MPKKIDVVKTLRFDGSTHYEADKPLLNVAAMTSIRAYNNLSAQLLYIRLSRFVYVLFTTYFSYNTPHTICYFLNPPIVQQGIKTRAREHYG